MKVPFFRPSIGDEEVRQVEDCLRSGWLTTGRRVLEFEEAFAAYVGARHAIALTSCTAALHLALEAVGVQRGDRVLVPALTFAATAEVVHYFDAIPVLVDSESTSLCMSAEAAKDTLARIARGERVAGGIEGGPVRAIVPVHYGGQMADVGALRRLAERHHLHLIEDAAHTLPAAYRESTSEPWQSVGQSAEITCFSFYANKCITTGEGGMAVTDDDRIAQRIRTMSLHGLSRDAWTRYRDVGSWYYEIEAAGYKYNMTDIAAAIGNCQLSRADQFRSERQRVAVAYRELLTDVPGIELPEEHANRQHAWHLFAIRVDPGVWTRGRDRLIQDLSKRGIGTSVHWMPLHLHPYYRQVYSFQEDDLPVAMREWARLVSLPIFPSMTADEIAYVADAIKDLAP